LGLKLTLELILFLKIDVNGNGVIDKEELGPLLEALKVKMPGYKLRDLKEECGDTVDLDEFVEVKY
jgi:Ca2+-binding EF-hand superfamily protein